MSRIIFALVVLVCASAVSARDLKQGPTLGNVVGTAVDFVTGSGGGGNNNNQQRNNNNNNNNQQRTYTTTTTRNTNSNSYSNNNNNNNQGWQTVSTSSRNSQAQPNPDALRMWREYTSACTGGRWQSAVTSQSTCAELAGRLCARNDVKCERGTTEFLDAYGTCIGRGNDNTMVLTLV